WTPMARSSVTTGVVPTTVPVPSFHSNWSGSPSGSLEPRPSRVIGWPSSTVWSGPASATGGRLIVNRASPASLTSSRPVQVTRRRADGVLGPVPVQAKAPEPASDAGAAAASTVQDWPPSRVSSTRNVADAPRLCVQRIVCTLPAAQTTGVSGTVTVTTGWTIENSDVSAAVLPAPSVAVTRSRALAVAGPGDAQVHRRRSPARSVQPGTGAKVAPPSVETRTSKRASVPLSRAVHRTSYG